MRPVPAPGARFEHLQVLAWAPAPVGQSGQRTVSVYLFARCDCGEVIYCSWRGIRLRRRVSCGCVKPQHVPRREPAQPGDTFTRLTVLHDGAKTRDGRRTVVCSCSCGTPRFRVRVTSLQGGLTRSCGCLATEALGRLNASKRERATA